MALFKKRGAQEDARLTALRAREAELVARQRALEAQHLESFDIEESERMLGEINDLNAQIGVVRDEISDALN